MAIKSEKRNLIVEQKPSLTEEQITQFGRSWFDKLNRHIDVEDIIKMVSDTSLEIVFPEKTIRNYDDFRDWYSTVGKTYYDQDHTIEKFDIQISDAAKIDVVVVWRAKQFSDDKSLAVRVTQTWVVTKSLTSGMPVITNYKVNTFSDA
jgi:hypothetical protein